MCFLFYCIHLYFVVNNITEEEEGVLMLVKISTTVIVADNHSRILSVILTSNLSKVETCLLHNDS